MRDLYGPQRDFNWFLDPPQKCQIRTPRSSFLLPIYISVKQVHFFQKHCIFFFPALFLLLSDEVWSGEGVWNHRNFQGSNPKTGKKVIFSVFPIKCHFFDVFLMFFLMFFWSIFWRFFDDFLIKFLLFFLNFFRIFLYDMKIFFYVRFLIKLGVITA